MLVFKSLAEAVRAGFQIYDRSVDGYLVRQQKANGIWVLALVRPE